MSCDSTHTRFTLQVKAQPSRQYRMVLVRRGCLPLNAIRKIAYRARFGEATLSYDLLIDRGEDSATPLGTIDEVRHAIDTVFPATQWSAPGSGGFEEGAASIEFNILEDVPITSFGILLHGEFIVFLERIDQLAANKGWSVFDPQGGDDA